MTIAEKIRQGKTCLGIELGSTRIKASLIDDTYAPVAGGSYSWENQFENGYWTYSLDEIHQGVQACYTDLVRDVSEKYDVQLTGFSALGISAMMHGYMAFDEKDMLLTPFRTWRNTTTEAAAAELTELLHFNIPQRWSIAHLYQAVLNGEAHLSRVSYVSTLAGYIHYLLTGRREVGIGEASGMFPVDHGGYHGEYETLVNRRLAEKGFCHRISEIFPAVRMAGAQGAYLTSEGAAFLDPSGNLRAGIPVCPPEGDAGTGMTATSSILPRTGNISAGTSVFSMLVLEKPLKGCYPEIDVVTTPDGAPVAMVHCNNCCGELDAWVKMFGEFAALTGNPMDVSALYETLYRHALTASAGQGGLTMYNYISGEPVTGIETGCPMYFRKGDRPLTLGGFFRGQLYASVAALKMGMDILFEKEHVRADGFTGHGGLFKVEGVAQQILADALCVPITTMQTAGEGGAWGMALLAAYMICGEGTSLADFLSRRVFTEMRTSVSMPAETGVQDFEGFMQCYRKGLSVQKAASEL
ncbi:MAG: ATPase [Ruminococcus sp.]|nr:ATPase [Ruminococcus sp.]